MPGKEAIAMRKPADPETHSWQSPEGLCRCSCLSPRERPSLMFGCVCRWRFRWKGGVIKSRRNRRKKTCCSWQPTKL